MRGGMLGLIVLLAGLGAPLAPPPPPRPLPPPPVIPQTPPPPPPVEAVPVGRRVPARQRPSKSSKKSWRPKSARRGGGR